MAHNESDITEERVQKREYFRVVYPHLARPQLIDLSDNKSYPVMDICEGGVRYCSDDGIVKQADGPDEQKMAARILFNASDALDLEGKILRNEGPETVLAFLERKPVLSRIIMAEQRYLLSHGYKSFIKDSMGDYKDD